jgi:hypothetical protein
MVFFKLGTVMQRHVPAAKINHFGAEPAMGVIQDSFLCHIKALKEGVSLFSETKKGRTQASSPPCP